MSKREGQESDCPFKPGDKVVYMGNPDLQSINADVADIGQMMTVVEAPSMSPGCIFVRCKFDPPQEHPMFPDRVVYSADFESPWGNFRLADGSAWEKETI